MELPLRMRPPDGSARLQSWQGKDPVVLLLEIPEFFQPHARTCREAAFAHLLLLAMHEASLR